MSEVQSSGTEISQSMVSEGLGRGRVELRRFIWMVDRDEYLGCVLA